MICKFNVGDQVKVNGNLKEGYDFKIYCNHKMTKYKNKIATIKKIRTVNDVHRMTLDIDDGEWVWTDDMLECVPKKSDVRVIEYLPTLQNVIIKEGNTIIESRTDHINKEEIKVIVSNNTTIVILDDGTKGISKCLPDDTFDENKGFSIALKKAYLKKLQKELSILCK